MNKITKNILVSTALSCVLMSGVYAQDSAMPERPKTVAPRAPARPMAPTPNLPNTAPARPSAPAPETVLIIKSIDTDIAYVNDIIKGAGSGTTFTVGGTTLQVQEYTRKEMLELAQPLVDTLKTLKAFLLKNPEKMPQESTVQNILNFPAYFEEYKNSKLPSPSTTKITQGLRFLKKEADRVQQDTK